MGNTLSLTLIVKNEEQHLPRILQNAHLYADEIVIVDTGSDDRTKEIAKTYTDKVYDFVWCDDFSKARNFGIAQCTKDFILWLDADDVIPDSEAQKIKQLLAPSVDWDICCLPYHVGFDAKGGITQTISRERLFRNNINIAFRYPVHEGLVIHSEHKLTQIKNINIYHKTLPERLAEKRAQNKYLNILIKALELPEYCDSSKLWWFLAREYAAKFQTVEAINAYKVALGKHDYDALQAAMKSKIHYELGRVLCVMKQADEALLHFGAAMAIYPLWREPFFECGRLLFLLKRPREALQFFMCCQTIPLNPFDVTDMRIYDSYVFYDWLSLTFAALGDYKNAVACVKKALVFLPNDEKMKNNRAKWEGMVRSVSSQVSKHKKKK